MKTNNSIQFVTGKELFIKQNLQKSYSNLTPDECQH